MSSHSTVKEIVDAAFHEGINQGNKSASLAPMYTKLQTMSPEEAVRRISRIIARAKRDVLIAAKDYTPEEIADCIMEQDRLAHEKVVL